MDNRGRIIEVGKEREEKRLVEQERDHMREMARQAEGLAMIIGNLVTADGQGAEADGMLGGYGEGEQDRGG